MHRKFTDPTLPTSESSPPAITVRPRELLHGALLSAAAYTLSYPLLFSVNPLPLGLICGFNSHLGWIMLGIALGGWQLGGAAGWNITAAAAVLVLRLCFRRFRDHMGLGFSEFFRDLIRQGLLWIRTLGRDGTPHGAVNGTCAFPSETLHFKILVSLFCALIPCLGISISGGFAFYDLYGSLFYLLLTPLLTALFAHIDISEGKDTSPLQGATNSKIGAVAEAILLAGICFCGRSLHVLGLQPVVLLAVWVSLSQTKQRGVAVGLLWSLICGLPYDPFILPLLLGICIVYGMLREVIGAFSLLIATLGGAVYLLLFAKDAALWSLLPSLVMGVSLYSAKQRFGERQSPSAKASEAETPDEDAHLARMVMAQANHSKTLRTLSAISGAFSSLAESFREPKLFGQISEDKLQQICQEAFEAHCGGCQRPCVQREQASRRTAIRLISQRLRTQGEITEAEIPTVFRDCTMTASMIRQINERYAKACYDTLHYQGRELFSMNCDGISHLFRDVLHHEREHSEKMYPDLARHISDYLQKKNMPCRQVIVYGKVRLSIRMIGLSLAMLTVAPEEFRSDIGKFVGAEVSKLYYEGGEEGGIILHTLPAFELHCRYRSLALSGGASKDRSPCGDTVRTFEGPEGMYYVLLCDGMGHGKQAAITSSSCAVFLERTLHAGVSVPTALSLLNQYLLSRASGPELEISSTIDLFCFDRYTGHGELIKSGAAPSWLMRQGQPIYLCSHTLPIGILQTIDAHVLPLELMAGDHLIMMSDGVYDGKPETAAADWLEELLSHGAPNDQEELIRHMLQNAKKQPTLDDMTIISLCIEARTKKE